MPIVRVPDGKEVRFPDDMPRAEIKKIIAAKFPDAYGKETNSLAQKADDVLGAATSFDRGYTFGFGKKAGGLVNAIGAAPLDALLTDKSLTQAAKDRYNEIVEPAKYAQERFANKNPKTALALELGGALANPTNKILGGFLPKSGGLLTKAVGGGTVGAAGGYLYGTGNDADSSKDAAIGAAIGAAIPVAGVVARNAPRVVGNASSQILGKTTGAGSGSISSAFEAGKAGNTRFLENMRKPVSMEDTVIKANERLNKIRQARNMAYDEDIQFLRRAEDKIDLSPVIRDVKRTINAEAGGSSYMVDTDTAKVFDKVKNILNNFYKDNARHNVAGFDDLKKAIRNIKAPAGERAEMVRNSIAKTIENQIIKQSPSYKKIMDRYAKDSAVIDELKRTFSIDVRANPETTLRKLQSVTRNNANTDYGYREQLLSKLDPTGEIADAVSGSALNSLTPRGLFAQGFGGSALFLHNPLALAASSPRLIGESAYKLGRLNQKASKSLADFMSYLKKYTPQTTKNSTVGRVQNQAKNVSTPQKRDISPLEFIAKRKKRGSVTKVIDENGNISYIFGER